MRYSVSDVAEYGDLLVGPRIVDDSVKQRMREVLEDVRSGRFAEELFADDAADRPKFKQLRADGATRAQEIERVGKELRELAGIEGLLGAEAQGAHGVS
jgi:ketol-acid reductoisomerase